MALKAYLTTVCFGTNKAMDSSVWSCDCSCSPLLISSVSIVIWKTKLIGSFISLFRVPFNSINKWMFIFIRKKNHMVFKMQKSKVYSPDLSYYIISYQFIANWLMTKCMLLAYQYEKSTIQFIHAYTMYWQISCKAMPSCLIKLK